MLFPVFRRKTPSTRKGSQSRSLVVIDYEDHSRGGHFGPYLIWFISEFSKRFDTVLVFTPRPESTSDLLRLSEPHAPTNVSCHRIPLGPRKRFYRLKRKACPLSRIFKAAARLAPGQSIQGFVMWAYDLLIGDVAQGPSGAPWATLGCVSYARRGYTNQVADREARVEKLCDEHPDCVALLVWDQYVIPTGSQKLVWLPGYENSECSIDSGLAQAVNKHAGGRFSVGGFGILTGSRCINILLELALNHPEVRFVLVGRIDEKSVREDLRPRLKEQAPKNLLVLSGYQPESDFNAAMAACDAVLIDGTNYPVHSGIATRALLLGKWLMTTQANSWLCDMIREYDVGFVYGNDTGNFAEVGRNWQTTGGSERSKKSINSLVNPRGIGQVFDQVAERLTATNRKR